VGAWVPCSARGGGGVGGIGGGDAPGRVCGSWWCRGMRSVLVPEARGGGTPPRNSSGLTRALRRGGWGWGGRGVWKEGTGGTNGRWYEEEAKSPLLSRGGME